MRYSKVKEKLILLFDGKKLAAMPEEWGFFNEDNREIGRIGFAVNLTPETIIKAANRKADLFITHHPSVFEMKEKCDELLRKHNLIHAFFHAPLDDAEFGNSHSLAAALGLTDCKKSIPYENGYYWGITGRFQKAVTFERLKEKLSEILNEPLKGYKNNNVSIHKVCINAGGGDAIPKLQEAIKDDCDVYITGGYNLEFLLYAKYRKISLLIGSHTNTELFGIQNAALLLAAKTNIETFRIEESNY